MFNGNGHVFYLKHFSLLKKWVSITLNTRLITNSYKSCYIYVLAYLDQHSKIFKHGVLFSWGHCFVWHAKTMLIWLATTRKFSRLPSIQCKAASDFDSPRRIYPLVTLPYLPVPRFSDPFRTFCDGIVQSLCISDSKWSTGVSSIPITNDEWTYPASCNSAKHLY